MFSTTLISAPVTTVRAITQILAKLLTRSVAQVARFDREREMENRTSPIIIGRPQPSTVRLDDRSTNR
jgi:hypothetical protein